MHSSWKGRKFRKGSLCCSYWSTDSFVANIPDNNRYNTIVLWQRRNIWRVPWSSSHWGTYSFVANVRLCLALFAIKYFYLHSDFFSCGVTCLALVRAVRILGCTKSEHLSVAHRHLHFLPFLHFPTHDPRKWNICGFVFGSAHYS